VLRVFADGGTYDSEETVFTADGRPVDMIVQAAPFRHDAGGNVVEVVEMSTNITEVRRLKDELAIMGRAVSEMAHRIKNIVMGLEGGIYVVDIGMQDGDEEALAKGWRMVEGNVRKVSAVVRDLLYCSKTREPSMQDGVRPLGLLEDVCELFRHRARDHGIRLDLEVVRDPGPGRYDPEGLHGMMTNLVANALDACRFDPAEDKDHRIVVRCDVDPLGHTVIEVSDTGVGIPRELANKVFEDYFSTKGTEGTGLGLLVAKKTVEEHGGTIAFDSVENRGTVFRITLPATDV
jgi:signal transduction histidine kinase